MAFFKLVRPVSTAGPRSCDGMIVSAADANDAKAIAKSAETGDSDAAWAAATVTQLADVAANAPGLANWRMRARILNSTPVIDLEVVNTGANDTIDELAALMVTALNATSIIDNAAYNSTSQTLTLAGTADNLGDKTIQVEILPPATQLGAVPIPGMVGTLTHNGSAGAALTAVLAADTYVVPTVLQRFKNPT